MERRRQLMGMQTELPGAYRRVEYIEGNGIQYIDTGITIAEISNLSTNWEIVFAITSFNRVQIVAGSDYNAKQIPILSKKIRLDWAGNAGNYFSDEMTENTIYALKQYAGDFIFNEESATINNASTRDGHFALFAKFRGLNNPELTTIAFMRLYKFTAQNNNGAILNLIPCVRKSDNKPGMYDTVSKTFYTNAGTGEFIVPA